MFLGCLSVGHDCEPCFTRRETVRCFTPNPPWALASTRTRVDLPYSHHHTALRGLQENDATSESVVSIAVLLTRT